MRPTWFTRAGRAVVAAAVLAAAVGVSPASAKPAPGRPTKRSGLNLFALTFGVMNVNRIFCGINNIGEVCVDPNNSPVVGGGFWPKGTPDQYIFNSGLQLAGTIPSSAGFTWAGDTVGAFFMDPRGDQTEGDPITLVYNSLDAGDAAAWPNGAVVRDTEIYNSVLINRNSVSQEDLWVRTWDGNPAFTGSARTHPMGVLVEERGLAWNYPSGNQDIIYFVYNFYNVTARNAAVYSNLDPNIKDEVAAIGQQFQDRNEATFGINIPDDGYPITNMFAAFFADMDVGDASLNYSTPVIPFAMGVAYKSNFLEPNWNFPPDIFGSPFVPSPGFIGVKYLRSPKDTAGNQIGLTVFSNTLNSASGYPDPVGVRQLYRYLSGSSNPSQGDFPCTFQGQQDVLHFCYVAQTAADTRFFQSSGPLTLNPGEKQTIVVAYINAAPTAAVSPFIGGDFKPGIPASGDSIGRNPALVRPIERAMGWLSQADRDTNFTISQDEVQTVPRSLLNKALVAQAVYDNKFLLPFAPDAPPFFLIPGNNQVTVVWQKSKSEDPVAGGDPFFAIASDPTSVLYDPNFRKFDVEGYRIYRGRTTGALSLVAQFDYSGTSLTDFTGAFAYSEDLDGDGKSECAPELGIQDDCPVTFDTAPPYTTSVDHPLTGNVVQIPAGGRVVLADSSVLILQADTAVTGLASGFPELSDNGVNFAYVDLGVRNSFTYFYAVTAFDLNSLKSGPTSIESARITKAVTPRAPSAQVVSGQLSALKLVGQDGVTLNPDAPLPTLDATTGEFSGAAPPTNGTSLGLAAFLPEVLDTGSLTLIVDSIVPGYVSIDFAPSVPLTYYLSVETPGGTQHVVIPVQQDLSSVNTSATVGFPALFAVQSKATVFGGDSTFQINGSGGVTIPGTWRITGWGRGSINGDPASSDFNGPRWWQGAPNENTPNPNSKLCSPAAGACVEADLSLNAGSLADLTGLFHVQGYSTVNSNPTRDMESMTSGVARAADFDVYWGAAGAIDSVHDATHHVTVPFSDKIRASWGLLTAASFAGVTGAPDSSNALLTWTDIFCAAPATPMFNKCGATAAPFMNAATLSPIAITASTFANAKTITTATGNGFIFYLNGHFFLMQAAALPATGTVWHARFYSGAITGSSGSYAFTDAVRPPAVPGLRISASFTGTTLDPTKTTTASLANVHTVPDPYYVTNALEATANTKILKFVNLPAQAIIRIYSLSGILVQVITHNDPSGGGEATWNLRNRNNQFVASGVYFYHVETPDNKTKVGRFTVVNFAP
ncbi:MAG TPA: T9SS type A sorting domain-containing protein [Gemmatimonadales bacterium]|nr:T9SS type A sorting domain-containing protein [Gemmatimonadales bacterium]